MAREFVATLDYETEPGGDDGDVRPQGQPPAHHRRHRRLPHRSRLRPRHHDPRRRGRGHQERPRGVPADQRADVRVVRRRQGAVRPSRSRSASRAPSTRPSRWARDADGNLTMPASVCGDALDPLISMSLWTGDLGLQDGSASSVYVLDKADATQVMKPNGQPFRMDLRPGESVDAARRSRTVTFDGLQRWNKIQISRSAGQAGRAWPASCSRCSACWARCSCGPAPCGSARAGRPTAPRSSRSPGWTAPRAATRRTAPPSSPRSWPSLAGPDRHQDDSTREDES